MVSKSFFPRVVKGQFCAEKGLLYIIIYLKIRVTTFCACEAEAIYHQRVYIEKIFNPVL